MKANFSPVVIGTGGISDSLNGGKQIELRQEVTRYYDDGNSLNDSLFDGVGNSYTEKRVAWRAVPEDATIDVVKAQLEKFPKARLQRILASHIIMSDTQDNFYKNGFTGTNAEKAFADFKLRTKVTSTTWDKACQDAYIKIVTESQLVKAGEGNTSNLPVGSPIPYKGEPQYKVVVFSREGAEDLDLRNTTAVTEAVDLAPTSIAEEKIAA